MPVVGGPSVLPSTDKRGCELCDSCVACEDERSRGVLMSESMGGEGVWLRVWPGSSRSSVQ